MRVVVDTGVLVSATITPRGRVSGVITQLSAGAYHLVYSQALRAELFEVLSRPTMHRRYGIEERHIQALEAVIGEWGEPVTPERRIQVCRDPKDDMILEAAVAGQVDLIVSGDEDLLVLGAFEGIPIVRPAYFLELLAEQSAGREPRAES